MWRQFYTLSLIERSEISAQPKQISNRCGGPLLSTFFILSSKNAKVKCETEGKRSLIVFEKNMLVKDENRENVFPFSHSMEETVFVFWKTKTTKTLRRFRKIWKTVFAFSRFRMLLNFCVFVFFFCTKTKRKTKTFSRFPFSLPTPGFKSVHQNAF